MKPMKNKTLALFCCMFGILTGIQAAQNDVYLTLIANGNDIQGESDVSSLEREDTIVCTAVTQETYSESGRLALGAFKFVKRVDKSSPLLYKALDNVEAIDATFRYFRPAIGGGGGEEHYYTFHLEQAQITSIRHWFPNTVDPAIINYPHSEEIVITFGRMTITYEDGGVVHTLNTVH